VFGEAKAAVPGGAFLERRRDDFNGSPVRSAVGPVLLELRQGR
jgi:hypothetical protein